MTDVASAHHRGRNPARAHSDADCRSRPMEPRFRRMQAPWPRECPCKPNTLALGCRRCVVPLGGFGFVPGSDDPGVVAVGAVAVSCLSLRRGLQRLLKLLRVIQMLLDAWQRGSGPFGCRRGRRCQSSHRTFRRCPSHGSARGRRAAASGGGAGAARADGSSGLLRLVLQHTGRRPCARRPSRPCTSCRIRRLMLQTACPASSGACDRGPWAT